MCGRYVLAADPNIFQQAFDLPDLPDIAPRYNIAPTQTAPVITNQSPRAVSMYRWGLIPSWAKDASLGGKMINARSESVEDKPAFRAAFKRRRCIVPASGFYEWQAGPHGKTPLFIYPTDGGLFAFAGLWEVWHDPSGSEVRTFTILTTGANEFMRGIHERMPVILHREDFEQWLDPDEVPPAVLRDLLRPYEPDRMRAHEVSKLVNRPTVDTPDLILPVGA